MPTSFTLHCLGCPYAESLHLGDSFTTSAASPLSMENNGARTLLIFQSPGVEEWRVKRPLASLHGGSAGDNIRRAFARVGKTREDFNITNSVQCYQGKLQAQGKLAPRDKKPSEIARKHCANWLRLDIEKYDYSRIVVFGAVAMKSVLSLNCFPDAKTIYLPHPSAGLSNEKLLAALGNTASEVSTTMTSRP